jgi:biotin synthase
MQPNLLAEPAPTLLPPIALDQRPPEALLERAGHTARSHFGPRAFVRAVLEVSNFCRQNCTYCGMRRDNKSLARYRADTDILRRILFDELPSSVTDINFQTGEDPVAVREILLPLIHEITRNTRIGVSVCLGTLDAKLYDELFQAGARYYIIKLETGNAVHFRQLQAPGTLEKRIHAIRHLATNGWWVSSGFIAGLPGQTDSHLRETLDLLQSLPLAGSSVSPFIPGPDTPLAQATTAPFGLALHCLAWMRLMNPTHVIPAVSAMNIVQSDGYVRALRAGANLTTINLTPEAWRDDYLLYRRSRVIMGEQRVLDAIEAAGLEPSTTGLIEFLSRKSTPPPA